MSAPLDPSTVRQFLETVGTKLDALPDPYKTIGEKSVATKLSIRLLGKLGILQEKETEITRRCVREVGRLQQAAVGSCSITGFESGRMNYGETK